MRNLIGRGLAILALATMVVSGSAVAGPDKPLVMESGQLKQLPAATTLQLQAPTTGAATINLPHGAAPSSPINGDCWTTTGGLYCRINGATVGPYGSGAGGTITLTGDVSGSGTSSITTAIGSNKVTRGMLAQTPSAGLLGATSAANVTDLTGTQATSLLDTFTSSLKGLAPASGGGTANFLRADGSWASPPGSSPSGPLTSSGYTMSTGKVIGRSTASTGSPEELSISQALDLIGSATQGDILYRDASGWARLGAGSAGQLLVSQGAGANPVWANVLGGGSGGSGNAFISVRLLNRAFSSGSPTSTTINVNSTSYTNASGLFFTIDLSTFPFAQYRVIIVGQSNAAGATVTGQLATFASPTTAIHTGGDDITLPNTFTTYDSGWLTRNDGATGLKEYGFVLKGSNSTVDLSANYIEILLKL